MGNTEKEKAANSDYDWGSNEPKPETKTTIEPEKKTESEIPPQDKILVLKNKMRELKATYEKVYGEHIDVEIMYFRAPKKIFPYIVRSLNMKDMGQIDLEIKEKVQTLISLRKKMLADKSSGSKKEAENFESVAIKSITDEEYENIEWYATIGKAVLYPTNIAEMVEAGNILPGHFRGIMEFIYMLSGYTPPIFDTDSPDDAIEFNAPEGVEVD